MSIFSSNTFLKRNPYKRIYQTSFNSFDNSISDRARQIDELNDMGKIIWKQLDFLTYWSTEES